MGRLLVLVVLAVIAFKLFTGRWPWQPKISAREKTLLRARHLLGVDAGASKQDIIAAHRRVVSAVHPDRGGSNAQVHEASAARDLLLEMSARDTARKP